MTEEVRHPADCGFCRNWETFNQELGDEQPVPVHLYMKARWTAPAGDGGTPVGKHAGSPSDRLTTAQVAFAVSLFSFGLSLVAFLFALWVFLR